MAKEQMDTRKRPRRQTLERKKRSATRKHVLVATSLLRVNNLLSALSAGFFVGYSIFILSTTAIRQIQLYCYIYNALGALIFGISCWCVGKEKYMKTTLWIYMFLIVCCAVTLSGVGVELFHNEGETQEKIATDVKLVWLEPNKYVVDKNKSRLLPSSPDDIQLEFRCCGRYNWTEYGNDVYSRMPESCCEPNPKKMPGECPGYKNTTGCVHVLTNQFVLQVDVLLISNWTLIILQIISLALCCYMQCKLYHFNVYSFLMGQINYVNDMRK